LVDFQNATVLLTKNPTFFRVKMQLFIKNFVGLLAYCWLILRILFDVAARVD